MLLCSIEKVPAFVLRNSKIHFTCNRAKIALKPSFCLLNCGLCQEPTQPHHYCSHLVYCFALQGCFMAASEWCSRSEESRALPQGCLGIKASGFTFWIWTVPKHHNGHFISAWIGKGTCSKLFAFEGAEWKILVFSHWNPPRKVQTSGAEVINVKFFYVHLSLTEKIK